jgi:hypothetical protein
MSDDESPRKYIHDWAKNGDGVVPKGAKLSDIVDDSYVRSSPFRQPRPVISHHSRGTTSGAFLHSRAGDNPAFLPAARHPSRYRLQGATALRGRSGFLTQEGLRRTLVVLRSVPPVVNPAPSSKRHS